MKIAILGCDSSHTEEYTRVFMARGLSVSFFWDPDPQVAREKHNIYGVGEVVIQLEDAISKADLVMVEGRYGDSHFHPAKEALLMGKKVYIDKPATLNASEARRLAKVANEQRAVLRSFSPLLLDSKYQEFCQLNKESSVFLVSSPAFCWVIDHEKTKDLSFYASHGTDLLSRLIPEMPKEVKVTPNEKGLWVDVFYYSGVRGVLNLVDKAEEFYRVLALSGHKQESIDINPFGDMYERTADYILNEFSKEEWRHDQFDQALVSMYLIDQIKLLSGARAWKK